LVLATQLAYQAPYYIWAIVDVSEKTDFATAAVFRQCHRNLVLGGIKTDKDPEILLHGSSPVREARRRPIRRNPRSSHNVDKPPPHRDEHTVCQTFSCGFNSGHLGGSGTMVMFGGTTRRADICQPA
jgi:hypothetical protein